MLKGSFELAREPRPVGDGDNGSNTSSSVSGDDPQWLFQLKYDGFRALAYVDRGTVQLVSRKGVVYKSFGALCTGR